MLQLEEYRKFQVHPNFERPHMTKRDLRMSRNELSSMNIIACVFLASVSVTFVAMAFATGTYFLPTLGAVWLVSFYTLVVVMADARARQSGNIYLLIHKEIVTDPEIGTSDCILIAYQPDTDMLHKVDTTYHVYREAVIGDWFFMFVNSDNEYTIPEHPNVEWKLLNTEEKGKTIV